MSQPVGMLRYRDQRGLTQGVEASTITRIEGLSPLGEGGCISKIHFKAESPVLSLDGSADLMDQFDEIVGSKSQARRERGHYRPFTVPAFIHKDFRQENQP